MRTPVPATLKRWWTPSRSAAPAALDERTLRIVFGLWVLAFALKHAGASWDLAWHFRFLRDDLIPPHIVNLIGNGIAAVLLAFQFRTGIAVERRGFVVMLIGFLMFITALPLDVLNHRYFGLDVTIWSIPHLMFFFGSTIVLAGLLWMWLLLAARGPWKTAYTFFFLMLLMDCMIFVLGQHEYGVLSVDAYLKGRSTASADLLALARGDVVGFTTGRLPHWLYPIWMVLTSSAALLVARRAQPGRWTATIVAFLYLAYRALTYTLLVAADFPPSFIPVMILGAALAIDLAARWRWRPALTAAALLVAFYGGAGLVGGLTLMPTFAPATALVVGGPLWAICAVAAAPRPAYDPARSAR
jgi:hypothetical protein